MIKRNRKTYAILILGVVILGLASRRYSKLLPEFFANYAGDTLWALMVFLIIGFILNKLKSKWVGLCALAFSIIIEISQLYHAPWIDAVRGTRIGALILGFGFLWSDLICYTVGILIGFLLEVLIKGEVTDE